MIEEETQPRAESGQGASEDSALARPEPAVQRWLDEHGDVLWRFVLGRTRSADVAGDVVQETILAAMLSHASFAGDSSERTWLLGIAAHKIADHFRRQSRREGIVAPKPADSPEVNDEFAGMFTDEGMWARQPGTWGLDPRNETENSETLAALRRCLDSLPPALSEVVWLCDLLKVPTSEACKALGITPTNLWSRTHRARAALRLCVEKSMGVTKDGTA